MKTDVSLSTSRMVRLATKELREILRDRRTILTLVLMPVLVYPLLGVMVKRGLLSTLQSTGVIPYRIVIDSKEAASLLEQQLLAGDALLPEDRKSPTDNPLAELAPQEVQGLRVELYVARDATSLEADVADSVVDVGFRLDDDSSSTSLRWTIIRRTDSSLSVDAFDYLVKRLEALNDEYVVKTLAAREITLQRPAEITERVVDGSGRRASPLVTFIPLVLVLMTMTGAVYPAIDLTAGERERGTMEILMAAPVSRITLLAGKFVAVLTVALLTASINMLSMFATLFTLGLDATIVGSSGLRIIPLVMLMMIVFAGFFSAVLLSITSVARSFKEAQAWLIPLMLISLTPGMFSLMPDLQIGPVLAVTPLVNIVLTGRDLLQGHFNLLVFTIAMLSTTFYGVVALAVAARVFGSDSVLYGSSGSWNDLLRPSAQRSAAPVSAALFALALVFPLFIVVGSIPARLAENVNQTLLMNIGVFLIVFVGVPFLVLHVSGTRVRSGLSWGWTVPARSLLAALLAGISMWAVLYEINLTAGVAAEAENLRRVLESLLDNLAVTPLSIKLAALAFAPAICEELFFRGFLQTSLRSRYSAKLSIVMSAVVFGLFHIVVRDHLFIERMIPSTIMGLLLGLMLEKSGSVLPGMLLHAVHNGLLIAVVHFQGYLEQLGIGMKEETHLPMTWLAPCILLALTAVGLMMSMHREGGTDPLLASPER